jgi:hypothetical protein
MEHAALIKRALSSLLGKPRGGDNRFVIIQHYSGKFVQYSGSAADPLLLDLPWDSLTEAELYNAAEYFKKPGGFSLEWEYHDVEGKPTGPGRSFNMLFRSVDRATGVALEVFFGAVFNLPTNVELAIEKGWET